MGRVLQRQRIDRAGSSILLVVLALLAAPPGHGAGVDPSAQTYEVRGPGQPLEILYDTWGVPHIYAGTIEDAFFGQGFAAARDRLWQMDSGHRRALGRVAELRGPAFVPYDRAARLLLFRGDEEAEWQRYDPRLRRIAIAFTAGINAFVQMTREQPELLPLEFKRRGYRPEFWSAADLLRIRAGNNTAWNDVRRAELACMGELAAATITYPLEPAWTPKVPEDVDPCAVKLNDLRQLELATGPLPAAAPTVGSPEGEASPDGNPEARDGSNAWAVAPRLSRTGRPILANDPHLPVGVPGIRWLSHLVAPGLNVIGAGAASNPGIQNGHNDRIAFGRTDFAIDQQDVFILTTKPDDPDQYLWQGGWTRFEVITEPVAVAGSPATTVTLKYSLAGPVISEEPAQSRAIALRAAWLEPGAATALQFIATDLASDWQSFKQAIRSAVFGTNYLYADVDGHIGWHPAGLVPVRPDHDGLLPVRGDGRDAWAGYMPLDLLPSALDPEQGFVASSNQMPLPPGYPSAERKIGFEWSGRDRYDRVVALLSRRSDHTLADSLAIQHDVMLDRAIRLGRLVAGLRSERPELRQAIDMLRSFDGRIEAGSAAAALYEAWWAELGAGLRDRLIPERLRRLLPFVNAALIVELLEHPDLRLGADPVAARDALMLAALGRASDDLAQRLGPDRTTWSWGRLHTVDLSHPLAAALPAEDRAALNVTGGTSGGEGSTVMARRGGYPNANVNHSASFSMVLDVGAWDESLALNSPGQSGNPASSHYRDLYRRWLAGEPFPLLFSRDRVEAATEARVVLRPAP